MEEDGSLIRLYPVPFRLINNSRQFRKWQWITARVEKAGTDGALYWNLRTAKGTGWEAAFRAKIESDLPSKDLIFLMGTVHRFPDQWLIASLIYPPKRQPGQLRQASLL